MKNIILASVIALLTFTFTAAAGQKALKYDILLPMPTTVAGTTLEPGGYQVLVDGRFVKFYRDGKEVAKAAVQGQENGRMFDVTETVIALDGHSIEEIDLAGTTVKWTLK